LIRGFILLPRRTQSVQIGERLVVGGDVTHFASGLDDHRFPIFGDDLDAQRASAQRPHALREAGAKVRPGHDPTILIPGPIPCLSAGLTGGGAPDGGDHRDRGSRLTEPGAGVPDGLVDRDSGSTRDRDSTSSPVSETVLADTPENLAKLTLQYAQGSAKFQALPALTQKVITALADLAADEPGKITPHLSAAQLSKLIAAYEQGVTA
jgi:hypothetical protein